MTALQKIIKGAKTLQKKNKNLSWKDAVKKSSKAYNAAKKPVRKTKPVKKVAKKIAAVKKRPVKKGTYTKTKSSKVNTRMLSGVGMYTVRDILEKNIKQTLNLIEQEKKKKGSREKAIVLKRLRANLSLQKVQLKQQNKLINQNLR